MGSSVSGTLAELTMQAIEQEIFDRSPVEIKLWRRYVDDVIAIIPKTRIEEFHDFINSINTNIQFEKELENESMLPFLDLKIIRQSEGNLKFKIHRKPTHSNRYLDAESNCPMSHKTSVIRSLVDRAFNLCSTEYLEPELLLIKSTLKSNGYNPRHINQIIQKKRISIINPQNTSSSDRDHDNPQLKYISIPYIKGTSERMGRILKQKNIILANRPTNSLKSQLSRLKDPIATDQKTNVVYEIPCRDCDKVYIGETGRNIKKRNQEHKYAIERRDPNS